MDIQVVFETGAFATTQEIWNKATNFLGLPYNHGSICIKRMGTNQIQIVKYLDVDQKSIFKNSAIHKTELIASFTGQLKGN
tara:strand:- start:981 stop:1223 length:243 start_codon:yes stop_codon:yes gene_type:complete